MCYKLDRSLLGVLVAVMLLVVPPVYALNDDVAVQLLERLNDLEGEVNALRSENENLKDKLDGAPTREEDEQRATADAEKASADDGINLEEQAKAVEPEVAVEPQIPGVNIIVEEAVGTADTADIPSLEQESAIPEVSATEASAARNSATDVPSVQTDFLTTSTADSAPALLNAGAATETSEAPLAIAPVEDKPTETTAVPVVTPTVSSTTTAEATAAQTPPAIDPKSKDSYYYYGTTEADKKTELKPVAAGVPAAANPVVTNNADQGRKAKADYNQAYQLLVNKPAEAVPLFRAFLASYPQHELAANAQYWLAEALYAQKDFDGASQEFMKVLKQYKDSPKSSGAALKLGYSFYELQQWDYARRTLEDTVRFFPDSSSAKLAEIRLQKMKEEGH